MYTTFSVIFFIFGGTGIIATIGAFSRGEIGDGFKFLLVSAAFIFAGIYFNKKRKEKNPPNTKPGNYKSNPVNNTSTQKPKRMTKAQREELERKERINEREQQKQLFIEKHQSIFKNWISNATEIALSLTNEEIKKQKIAEMPEYKTKNVTKSFNAEKLIDFVVIDVETTGLHVRTEKIIEVAAVRFEDFRPVEYISTFINPNKPIPEDASKINGIKDENVANAPVISQILPALNDFIGKSPVVAHNLSFDMKFLYYDGLKILDTKREYYDTLELSRKAYKDMYSYSLDSLCKQLEIYPPSFHRALYDCYATGALFGHCLSEITETFAFSII